MKPTGSLFAVAIWLCAAGPLAAQAPADLIAAGRAMLATNLAGAYAKFNQAVALSPTNATANLLAGATRILALSQQPAGSNFLTRLGFPGAGRDIHDWEAQLPRDANGHTVMPANFNSSEAIAFYTTNIMPAILASQTNLARVTDRTFTLDLSADETSVEAVTLDYGDIQILRALLYAGDFIGHTATAHNFNVLLDHLKDLSTNQPSQLTVQRVLADYHNLLGKANPSDLATSQAGFTNAVARYLEASDFIRNTNYRPAGAERLFELAPDKETEEATFRDGLTKALASLTQPVLVSSNSPAEVYAAAYFSGATSLRSLLPQFNGNRYVYNSLPDYTFGGVLINEPAWQTEKALRKKLAPSYAGIYVGQPGSYHQINNHWVFVPSGAFALLVDTNQQAILLGADTNNAVGLFGAWLVDKNGQGGGDTNGLSSWLDIYSDGSVYGSVQPTNGKWSDQLQGNLAPEIGPFQSFDGYYAGTWSGGGQHGKLQGILAADGAFYFCASDSAGAIGDGGWGQYNADGSLVALTDVQGTTLSGTLNRTTLSISGTYHASSSSGTWTMRRSDFALADVSPTITSGPQDQTAAVGQAATFRVIAAGSAPLCYQWSRNGATLTGATSSALTLSNLQLGDDGAAFAVEVHNVAGVTNASATLHVQNRPDNVPPTITMTAPTSGERWSNAVFTVRGRATDNVQVAAVFCQVNGGDWTQATGTANWTAAVTLAPGTNSVSAYAVDASGNRSATNTVLLRYVVSSALAVRVTGEGKVTPNLDGHVLELGSVNSIVAQGTNGFQFTNWTSNIDGVLTNGPKLSFVMQSNLVLTANFVDKTPPGIRITSPKNRAVLTEPALTLSGTASDNDAVAAVWCQLSTNAWAQAAGTANWSLGLTLLPGTNTLRAYALDRSQNRSAPSSVTVTYKLYAPLTLLKVGQGSLALNYTNHQMLQIGQPYSLTARPLTGFRFAGWSGSLVSTNSTLSFTMASNLVLIATFVDNKAPVDVITYPQVGRRLTNGIITVLGGALDNVGVTNVWCSFNNTNWLVTLTTNQWTNWWATNVVLAKGTNLLQTYAEDAAGNVSKTNSVKFTH